MDNVSHCLVFVTKFITVPMVQMKNQTIVEDSTFVEMMNLRVEFMALVSLMNMSMMVYNIVRMEKMKLDLDKKLQLVTTFI